MTIEHVTREINRILSAIGAVEPKVAKPAVSAKKAGGAARKTAKPAGKKAAKTAKKAVKAAPKGRKAASSKAGKAKRKAAPPATGGAAGKSNNSGNIVRNNTISGTSNGQGPQGVQGSRLIIGKNWAAEGVIPAQYSNNVCGAGCVITP